MRQIAFLLAAGALAAAACDTGCGSGWTYYVLLDASTTDERAAEIASTEDCEVRPRTSDGQPELNCGTACNDEDDELYTADREDIEARLSVYPEYDRIVPDPWTS